MSAESLPPDRRLRQEILFARERVYRFGQPTPLERLTLPGNEPGPEVWIKREDLTAVKSYKWRGACNVMASLTPEQTACGVVTASAGNHAQGVAMAAKMLGIHARVYMPRSTPRVKQHAVKHHGGDWVEIRLSGDSYDEAVTAARADEAQSGSTYVQAYDDFRVMAGQGTLADEVVLSGHGPFDAAFLQIGGGGMAAGVSTWLKTYWPQIDIIGVEGVDQNSMQRAIQAGFPFAMERVDIFCDGTAVRKAGTNPFEICRSTIDRFELVTNAEVSQAIRILWESHRCISEPSGAMGLAAVLKNRAALTGKKVLIVLSGANIDFLQLGLIAAQTSGSIHTRTLRVRIPERPGSMLALMDQCFAGLNITDFQYGKQHSSEAWPIFTISAEQEQGLLALPSALDKAGYQWEDLTGAVDVQFRAIPLRGDLLGCPAFVRLDFYERPGALHDFLSRVLKDQVSLCYFNYRQTGERIGRALLGLDFASPEHRQHFLANLPVQGDGYRSCQVINAEASARLIGD